jgi:hypothetical protein
VTDGLHAVAEDRSLELHRAVAERLRSNPALVERARDRVARWLRDGTVARPYAEAWQAVLGRPLEELTVFLVDPGEQACRLRQTSPFAGVLAPRERWDILRRMREGTARR